MNKFDQERIIIELCDSTKRYMLERINNVPEEWDGIELRQWHADVAAQSAHPMERKRAKNYHSTIYNNNL